MRTCPHCEQPVFPEDDDSVEEGGQWWHDYCYEDSVAQRAEDERLDDPRHGQAEDINRGR